MTGILLSIDITANDFRWILSRFTDERLGANPRIVDPMKAVSLRPDAWEYLRSPGFLEGHDEVRPGMKRRQQLPT